MISAPHLRTHETRAAGSDLSVWAGPRRGFAAADRILRRRNIRSCRDPSIHPSPLRPHVLPADFTWQPGHRWIGRLARRCDSRSSLSPPNRRPGSNTDLARRPPRKSHSPAARSNELIFYLLSIIYMAYRSHVIDLYRFSLAHSRVEAAADARRGG